MKSITLIPDSHICCEDDIDPNGKCYCGAWYAEYDVNFGDVNFGMGADIVETDADADAATQSTLAVRLDEIIQAVRDGVADAEVREMRRFLLDIFA